MWKKKALAIGLSFACLFGVSGIIASSTSTFDAIVDADGTDREDDGEIIQRYLDMAQNRTAPGMFCIKIPKGTYYVDRQLVIHSNTSLYLEKGAKIVRTNPEKILIRSEQTYTDPTKADLNPITDTVPGYGQNSNIMIQGGTWDGGATGDVVCPPIMYFSHGKNVTLQDFSVQNQCSRHMVILTGVDTAHVTGLKLSNHIALKGEDVNGDYYTFEGEQGASGQDVSMRTMEALHLDVIDPTGVSEGYAYPLDGTVNNNIVVENCTFSNVLSGVGNHYMIDPNLKSSGLVVQNNTFDNVKYTCVDIYNQTDALVTGNKAKNVGEFARAVQSSTEISGNTATCNKPIAKSDLNLCGIKADNCSKVTISRNTLNKGFHGISVTNCAGKILDNTVTNSVQNGITIPEGSSRLFVECSGNTVTNAGATGIYYDKTDGSIKENTINTCGSHGIAVYNTNTKEVYRKIDISENTISDTKEYGICINTAQANVTKNQIDQTTGHGIYALENSIVTVEENQIGMKENSRIGQNGIYLNKTTKSGVKNNAIGRCGENGILIFESNGSGTAKMDVSSNLVESGAEGNGIRVEESRYVSLLKNTVSGCKQAGIQLYHAQNVDISGCSSLNNTVEGIYAYDTGAVVATGNTIGCIVSADEQATVLEEDMSEAECGHPNGITVEASKTFTANSNIINTCENGIVASGTDVKLISNKIESAKDRGIWLIEGASGSEILENTISGVANYGIHAFEAQIYLAQSNHIKDVGKIGIYAYGGNGYYANKPCVIDGNDVTNTGDSGIRVDNVNYAKVQNNTVTSVKASAIHGFKDTSLTVYNNTITGNALEGIAIHNSTTVSVTENTIKPGTKVKLKDNSNGIALYEVQKATIQKNSIDTETNGILANGTTSSQILSNTINNMTSKGVWVLQNSDVALTSNTITNTQAEGIHFLDSKGSIESNTVTNTAQNAKDSKNTKPAGAAIYVYNATGNKNSLFVLKGNIVTTSGASGIRVDNSTFVNFTDNTVTDTGKSALHLYKTNTAQITGKTPILGNGEEGIAIHDCDTVKVQGITIGGDQKIASNLKYNAITVANSKTVTLTENTLDGALNAILYSNSTGSVTGNVLRNVTERGVWCTDGSNLTIMGNEIPTPGTMGIHLTDSTGSVEKNNITSPKESGIYVYNAKATAKEVSKVTENTVTSPGSFGIKVEKSEYITADGNAISAAKSISLNAVDCANVTLTGNVITGNMAEGIGGFNCNTLEVSGNKITPGDQVKVYADGIKIDGSGSGSSNVTVKENSITGAKNGLNIFVVSSGSASGNTFSNITEKGIWVQGIDGKAARFDVTGNTIPKTGKEGIHYVKATGTIKENKISESGGVGIYLFDGVGTEKIASLIDQNTITQPGAQGIKAENCAYVTISNNAIQAPKERAINLAGTNYSSINTNTVTGNAKEGIFVFNGENVSAEGNVLKPGDTITEYADAITFSNVRGASIKANEIEGAKVGINFNTGATGTISGNKLKTIKSRGIAVSTQCNANVDGNEITSPAENGIHFYQSTGNATNNIVTNPGKNGILFFEAVGNEKTPNVIEGNTVTSPKEAGIRAEGSNDKEDGTKGVRADYVSIGKNKISDAGAKSVHIYKVDHVTVDSNTITQNKAEGIYVYDGAVAQVSGNTITPGLEVTNPATAIAISTISDVKVLNNTITGAENGIVVNQSGNGTITENTISNANGNSVALTGVKNATAMSNVVKGGDNGILWNATSGNIQGNKIENVGGRGIWLLEQASASVTENEVTNAGNHGIHLNNSMGSVTKNTLTQTAGNGIYAYECKGNGDAPILIGENNVSKATGKGIAAEQSQYVNILANAITDSGKQGIGVTSQSANAKVNNNTVQNSAEHGIIIDSATGITVDANQIEGSGKKEISILNGSTGTGKENVVGVDEVYIYDPSKFPVEYKLKAPQVVVTEAFTDVPAGQWYVGAVQFVLDNGIMSGVGDGKFNPNGQLTRSQFVTVLHNMENKPEAEYQNIFTDVGTGQWYTQPVMWAYSNKITSGIGEGLFGTNNLITREQLATMLYSYAKIKGLDLSAPEGTIDSFPDQAKVDSWAREAMNWAVSHGVMSGTGAGLEPLGIANRAQCAQMIKNLKEKVG